MASCLGIRAQPDWIDPINESRERQSRIRRVCTAPALRHWFPKNFFSAPSLLCDSTGTFVK
jgi:hypothetical protein